MAGGAGLGALFGEGFAILHDTVKEVGSKVLMFKSILKSLESTLDEFAPIVKEIEQFNEQLDRKKEETERLTEAMKKGGELIRKCLKIRWWNWNYCYKAYCYSTELQELEKAILKFCQLNLQVQNTRNTLQITYTMNRVLEKVDSLQETVDSLHGTPVPVVSCAVSKPPEYTVGLDIPMKKLKTLLLKEEVQLLLLASPGGCGKTTLVQMLCQDEQIQGFFKDNILFVTVSKTPNVKVIVQNLFNYKGTQPKFQIQSDKDAIDQLPQLLDHIGPDPILLILDDVWDGSESLPEDFKIDIPNYKILVTSRTAFPRFGFHHNLEPLNEVDAMKLFRHSLQDGSSGIPDGISEEDIKKIVRGCGGFPLVLKVIGGSLRGQHLHVWKRRLMDWSDGQFFFNSDTGKLLDHLQKSLEFPKDKITIKECFMDLGSFPEDQRIHIAASLICGQNYMN